MARKFKFPDPKDYPAKTPAVSCPADRVLNLYNQAHEKEAKRITKKVKDWTAQQAHDQGWDGIHFLPEVQSQHGAGCMLWQAHNKTEIRTVEINRTTLVLSDESDDEE